MFKDDIHPVVGGIKSLVGEGGARAIPIDAVATAHTVSQRIQWGIVRGAAFVRPGRFWRSTGPLDLPGIVAGVSMLAVKHPPREPPTSFAAI